MDKAINVVLGAKIDGLKSGMAEASIVMKQTAETMTGAAESIDKKTRPAVENLRTSYRAAAKDAYSLAMSQGQNSDAFKEATQRAGALKDEFDLVNAKIKAFTSDTPILTASLGVGKGLAGAFAAAQGAMGLFGAKSEEVQQALLKVQSALALTQGLQAVGELKDAFSAFGAVMEAKVLPALIEVQTFFMANPILAITAALAAAVVAWGMYSDSVDKATESEKENAIAALPLMDKIKQRTKSLQESAEKLDMEVTAKKKGLQVTELEIELNNKRIAQIKQQIALYNEGLNVKDAANIKINPDDDPEIKLLRAQNIELQKNADLQKQKDALSNAAKAIEIKPKDIKIKAPKIELSDMERTIRSVNGKLKDATATMFEDAFDPEKVKDVWGKIGDEVNTGVDKITAKFSDMKDTIKQLSVQAFGDLAFIIGESLGGANQDLGKEMFKMIGNLAKQLGAALILLGSGLSLAPGFQTMSIPMLAAGAALEVAAGVISAMSASSGSASGSASSSSSGSSSSGNYNNNLSVGGFQSTALQISLSGLIRGNNLIVVDANQGRQNKRIK